MSYKVKCTACGHEYHIGHDSPEDDFILIEGNFYEDGVDTKRPIKLTACPKCGTVQINNWRY